MRKLLGIDVWSTHTTAQHEIGSRVEDIAGGDSPESVTRLQQIGTSVTKVWYPGAVYKYIKAGSSIAAGDALVVSLADADEPETLVPSSAVAQVVVGIAHVAIASGSYGFVQIAGRMSGAKNTGSLAAGAKLVSSGTAGALAALAQADTNFSSNNINALIAMAAGIGIMALDSNDSNAALIEVLIT